MIMGSVYDFALLLFLAPFLSTASSPTFNYVELDTYGRDNGFNRRQLLNVEPAVVEKAITEALLEFNMVHDRELAPVVTFALRGMGLEGEFCPPDSLYINIYLIANHPMRHVQSIEWHELVHMLQYQDGRFPAYEQARLIDLGFRAENPSLPWEDATRIIKRELERLGILEEAKEDSRVCETEASIEETWYLKKYLDSATDDERESLEGRFPDIEAIQPTERWED